MHTLIFNLKSDSYQVCCQLFYYFFRNIARSQKTIKKIIKYKHKKVSNIKLQKNLIEEILRCLHEKNMHLCAGDRENVKCGMLLNYTTR